MTIAHFISASTLDEALHTKAQAGADAITLAGGTDVMIQLQRGEIHGSLMLHIENLKELGVISTGDETVIGALVSHERLARDPAVKAFPALRESAGTVGGWQTQAVGTLGGNICNASPAADTLPALLIYDAEVELISASGGKKTLGLDQFVVDRRTIAMAPDELLVNVRLRPPSPRAASHYYKVGRRGAMEIAIVGMALYLELNPQDATVADARIAVGSVASKPLRVTASERMLIGQRLTAELVADAGQSLSAAISPIDDVRASRRYRTLVIPRVLQALIAQCAGELDQRAREVGA